jgi:hypothetical protein
MVRPALAAMLCAVALAGNAVGEDRNEDPTTTTEPASTTTTALAPETTTSSTSTSSTTPPSTSSTTTGTAPATTSSTSAPVTTSTTTTPPTTLPAPPGCIPGDPRSCDDGDACTLDACDSTSHACVHTPLDGTPCPDDGVGCTEDRCASGVCEHRPRDLRCDRGECATRACRPADPGADRQGCILIEDQSGTDGTRCTGDGFSCTEDVCMGGLCLHMPVDSACVPPDACRAARCAPAVAGHDEAGCVAGMPRGEGQTCAEDADLCTSDVCRAGTCAHERATDTSGCTPIQDAFQQTIALQNLTEDIGADVADTPVPALQSALARLSAVEAELATAADALAGHTVEPAVAGADAGPSRDLAADRAHIAFTMVLRTPRQVSAFLQTLAQARTRASIGRRAAHRLRLRGRVLLRGTRHLRASLRALAR